MATDTDSLVLSISADTTSIRNSLKKLLSDSKAATDGIKKNFDGIGNNDNFKNLRTNFDQSSKAIQNNARVLQYQINDIATSLGSGASAMQVFAQQAGQVQQTLAGGNGLAVLKAGLLGLVNPVNLTIAAFGVATYAVSKYYEEAAEGSGQFTKAMEEQLRQITAITSKFGESMPTLVAIREQLERIQSISQLSESKDTQWDGVKAAFKEIDAEAVNLMADLHDLGQFKEADTLRNQLIDLRKKVEDQTATTGDLAKIMDTLKSSTTAAALPGVKTLTDAISAAIPIFHQVGAAVDEVNKKIGQLKETSLRGGVSTIGDYVEQEANRIRATVRALDAGQASGGVAEFIRGREGFIAKAKRDNDGVFRVGFGSDTYVDQLGKVQQVTEQTTVTIGQAWQDLARRIGEFQRGIVSQIGPDFWASFDDQQKTALTSIAYNYGELPQRIVKAIQTGDKGQVAQAIAALGTDNGGINAKRRNLEAELFGGSDFSASAKTATQSFQELLDEASRGTSVLTATGEAMQSVAGSTDDYGYAVARAKKEQELLNKAQEEGITLTAAQKEQISAAAEAYGRAEQAINRQKDAAQDTARETKKNAQAWKELGDQLAGVATSAVTGLVNDLKNGVSAGEAFRNMLSKIADDLLQMALNQTLKSLFGSLFSGFGQAGVARAGGIGLYHQGGTAGFGTVRRQVSPLIFAGAPRMHNGGIAGLRNGEVPAILKRGEVVSPAGARGSSGNSFTTGDINIDMSSSGYVTADGADAKAWGEDVRRAVQIEMVRQSRPGGLLRKVPT